MQFKNTDELTHLLGEVVLDNRHEPIGKVEGVATNAETREPMWLVVRTSLLGGERVVPIGSVTIEENEIEVSFSRQMVLDSPVPEVLDTVAGHEAEALDRYYERAA